MYVHRWSRIPTRILARERAYSSSFTRNVRDLASPAKARSVSTANPSGTGQALQRSGSRATGTSRHHATCEVLFHTEVIRSCRVRWSFPTDGLAGRVYRRRLSTSRRREAPWPRPWAAVRPRPTPSPFGSPPWRALLLSGQSRVGRLDRISDVDAIEPGCARLIEPPRQDLAQIRGGHRLVDVTEVVDAEDTDAVWKPVREDAHDCAADRSSRSARSRGAASRWRGG